MNRTICVGTGEVRASKDHVMLGSGPIGSCVVIAAYDPQKRVGALAHVMLPGICPKGESLQETRYAVEAIDVLITRMTQLGANKDDIEVCLVGGGNMLKRDDDTICETNITSVIGILNEKRIKVATKALRGTERRTVTLDVEKGTVYYTQGEAVLSRKKVGLDEFIEGYKWQEVCVFHERCRYGKKFE